MPAAPLESFADLVRSALRQKEPHRLLFVFIRVDRPDGAPLPADGGTLSPVMYIDLPPAEELDFATLTRDADAQSPAWDWVMIGALSGTHGTPPTPARAEEVLQTMVRLIEAGGDLSPFVILDRAERPVRLSPAEPV